MAIVEAVVLVFFAALIWGIVAAGIGAAWENANGRDVSCFVATLALGPIAWVLAVACVPLRAALDSGGERGEGGDDG